MSEQLNPFASPLAVDSDRPEMAWAVDDPEALRRVKLGLTLVYYGICALILTVLASPFLSFMMFEQPGQTPTGAPSLVSFVMVGLILLLTLVIFAGEILCTAAPRESGARPLATAAVVLQGLSFVTALLTGLTESVVPMKVSMVGQAVAFLLGIASLVSFILFMRRLALFIQRRDVAGRATRSLVVGTVAAGLMIASPLIAVAVPDATLMPTAIPMMIGGIGVFVALIMYANTVTYLRKAIMI